MPLPYSNEAIMACEPERRDNTACVSPTVSTTGTRTGRLARSMARRAGLMCESAAESAELASTSAGTARRKCVTSSGRSSMSSRMRCTSG